MSADHGYESPAARVLAAAAVVPSDAGADESEAIAVNAPAANSNAEAGAAAVSSGSDDDGPPAFDDAAESAFLAEARERGEAVPRIAAAANGEPDENGGKPLPKLDELVNRIPQNVRDTLDELFRARFVSVKRLPKKALKA